MRDSVKMALAAMGAFAYFQRDNIRHLLQSATAKSLGIKNKPRDKKTKRNLVWLAGIEAQLTPIVRAYDPQAVMTSAYRAQELTDAIGGSRTSRHARGLALDYSVSDPYEAMMFLRSRAGILPYHTRTVIAETTPPHLHIDFYSPFEREQQTATRFLYEVGQHGSMRAA